MKEGKDKRSLKNLRLTKKYHFPYLGMPVFLSLVLLLLNYILTLAHFYLNADIRVHFTTLAVEVTILVALTGGLLIFNGVLAAHRIAGVHLRLEKLFNEVREGNLDARLHFRKDDRLDDVEQSFNLMMDVLKHRIDS